jgi:FkbM family methyltransferase
MRPTLKSVWINTRSVGRIKFPAADRIMVPSLRHTGSWEPAEEKWLRSTLKHGSHFVNIGANVGYFSVLASRIVGRDGHVTAVEPNPELSPYLSRNMKRLSRSRYTLHPVACGDSTGETTLYLNRRNFGDSRVFDPRVSEAGGTYLDHGFDTTPLTVEVPLVEADDLLSGGRVDVILIDAQGWDHRVIRGLSRTIEAFRPFVLAEFVPQWIDDLGDDPKAVLREWESLGYALGTPDLTDQHNGSVSPDELLSRANSEGRWFLNVSLTPLR